MYAQAVRIVGPDGMLAQHHAASGSRGFQLAAAAGDLVAVACTNQLSLYMHDPALPSRPAEGLRVVTRVFEQQISCLHFMLRPATDKVGPCNACSCHPGVSCD